MEKKRKTNWIVVFLLVLPLLFLLFFSQAKPCNALTALKDVWLYDGDTQVVRDVAYKIYHETYSNFTTIEYGPNLTKIGNNTCIDINIIRICLNNTAFVIAKSEDKVNLKFSLLEPDITVTRAISTTTPFLMEEVEVVTEINNTDGDFEVSVFNFTDTYPEEVEFTSIDASTAGAYIKNKTVYLQSRLKTGDNGIFLKYKFKVRKKIEQSLKAEYSYFDKEKIQTKYTTAFDLTPKHLILLTKSLAYESVYVGQNNNFTINLTKDYPNSSIDVKLRMFLSDNLVLEPLLGIDYFKKIANNTYEWSATMHNQSKGFLLYIYGKRMGASDIRLELYYEDPKDRKKNRKNYTDFQTQNFEIASKDIIVSTTLSEGEGLESYQEKNFSAYVANANRAADLHNVSITIYTNISEPFIIKKNVSKLAANEQLDFKFNLTAPNIASDTSTKFNITVSYSTEFGDSQTIILKRTIQLKAIKALALTCAPTKSTLEEEEKTTIAVSVQNPRQTDVKDAEIFDFSNFTITKGVVSKILDFHAGKTTNVYIYEIKAPKVKQQTIFNINTTVLYKFKDVIYRYHKITPITVKPKSLSLSVTRTYSVSAPFQGQLVDVDYVLTNNDLETAKDIYLYFRLQQDVDIIGNTKYYVGHLDPGEKITLDNIQTIRGKFNRTTSIEYAVLYYKDIDGNMFSLNTSKASLIFKYSFIDNPVIILHKNVSAEVGPSFPVKIKIENIGSRIAEDIEIKDGKKEWKITVSPGETVEFKYLKSLPPGEYTLDKAQAIYSFAGLNYTVASASPTISVSKDVIVVEENETNKTGLIGALKEKIAKSETGEKVSENLERTVQKSKSFFAKIGEFFKKLMFWKYLTAEAEASVNGEEVEDGTEAEDNADVEEAEDVADIEEEVGEGTSE